MIKRISIIKYIDQAKFSVGNDLPDVKTFFELSKVNFKEVIEKLVKTQLYKEWIKSIKKEFKIEALTKRVNKANKLIRESSKLIGDDYKVCMEADIQKDFMCLKETVLRMLQSNTNRDEDTLLRLTGKIDQCRKKEDGDGKIQCRLMRTVVLEITTFST